MSSERTPKKKRGTITFDPPEDVKLLLQKAQEATGATVTDLIAEAIRTDLPKVVRKIIEQRKTAEDEFFKLAQTQQSPERAEDPGQKRRKQAM